MSSNGQESTPPNPEKDIETTTPQSPEKDTETMPQNLEEDIERPRSTPVSGIQTPVSPNIQSPQALPPAQETHTQQQQQQPPSQSRNPFSGAASVTPLVLRDASTQAADGVSGNVQKPVRIAPKKAKTLTFQYPTPPLGSMSPRSTASTGSGNQLPVLAPKGGISLPHAANPQPELRFFHYRNPKQGFFPSTPQSSSKGSSSKPYEIGTIDFNSQPMNPSHRAGKPSIGSQPEQQQRQQQAKSSHGSALSHQHRPPSGPQKALQQPSSSVAKAQSFPHHPRPHHPPPIPSDIESFNPYAQPRLPNFALGSTGKTKAPTSRREEKKRSQQPNFKQEPSPSHPIPQKQANPITTSRNPFARGTSVPPLIMRNPSLGTARSQSEIPSRVEELEEEEQQGVASPVSEQTLEPRAASKRKRSPSIEIPDGDTIQESSLIESPENSTPIVDAPAGYTYYPLLSPKSQDSPAVGSGGGNGERRVFERKLRFIHQGRECISYADKSMTALDGYKATDSVHNIRTTRDGRAALVLHSMPLVPEIMVDAENLVTMHLYESPGQEYNVLYDVLKRMPPPIHRESVSGEEEGEIHYVDRFGHNTVMVMVDIAMLEAVPPLRRINPDGTGAEGEVHEFGSGGAIWGPLPESGQAEGARTYAGFPLLLEEDRHSALIMAVREALLLQPWSELGYRKVVIIHWSECLSGAMADKEYGNRVGGREGRLVGDLWEMVNSMRELYQVEVKFLEANFGEPQRGWLEGVARSGNLPVEVREGTVTLRSDEEFEWEGRRWKWEGWRKGWKQEEGGDEGGEGGLL
ncbi:hypothetical protein TWF481_005108 [Arthrobotrys musiformis]|uniref:RNase H type-1 domain-containing protein n=1 Tax=Arthrobotrys musiformis TaxID=47236 RepID=A0AAV9WER0_9PEZI